MRLIVLRIFVIQFPKVLKNMTESIPYKAVFNWSGGKDSALALYKIMKDRRYEVVSLLTTVDSSNGRSSMHGIPLELLEKQAESIGLPLYVVPLLPDGVLAGYEEAMEKAVKHFKAEGVTHFVFGDIFLHDVRKYRERQLSPLDMEVVEPLWGPSTKEIMGEFLDSGLKTVIVAVNASILGREYLGKELDRELVASFPENTDPCGENGEYHTFCYDGEIFRYPIRFAFGEPQSHSYKARLDTGDEIVTDYWFADLVCE